MHIIVLVSCVCIEDTIDGLIYTCFICFMFTLRFFFTQSQIPEMGVNDFKLQIFDLI